MATTTNYSWSTPDDTALVKDGAAAIRSLGTAIDTTVFNNAGAAIAKSIVDAKGDLIVGSAADSVARLAAGTNGYYLSANSSATNGVEWVAAPTGGSYTLLSTTTLSGTETSVTGISGSYQDLFIEVYGVTFSTSNFSPSLGLNSAGTFRYARLGTSYLTSDSTTQELNNQEVNWLYTSASNYLSFSIQDYTTTDRFKSFQVYGAYQAPSIIASYTHIGTYTNTSAITSVQFAIAGGRTFSSGTIKVWGVK